MKDIAQRLLEAYNDMRTGSREDLKEAADTIVALRKRIDEIQQESDRWFQRSTE